MANLVALPRTDSLAAISPSVRLAGAADVTGLARLINRAYEIEAAFVDGQRTDEAELRSLAERGHFLVLDAAGGALAAAVYVQVDGDSGHIAMLSVAPELQKLGLGTRLVAVAEALCTALGCRELRLEVINLREELGPWYRRRGYQEVGTAPIDDAGFKRPAHFVCMRKPLAGC